MQSFLIKKTYEEGYLILINSSIIFVNSEGATIDFDNIYDNIDWIYKDFATLELCDKENIFFDNMIEFNNKFIFAADLQRIYLS